MNNSQLNVASTVLDYLNAVNAEVNNIINPSTGSPVTIPNFIELYQAASKLDSSKTPGRDMLIIQSLLGRAASVGMEAPDTTYPLQFPSDHALHLKMGVEWYWIACHLNVKDQHGNAGRIAVLLDMQKTRAVGIEQQLQAGWTDLQATIATNLTTVVVDMPDSPKAIFRRSPNVQWPLKGGSFNCSAPNTNFLFQCGSDSLSGSLNVLPLDVKVNDGSNMMVDLTLSNVASLNTESAFFLQGVPVDAGNGGTGLTPVPTPGIYYSWPQLNVNAGGTVIVNGNTYTVESGSGWMDHQLMMNSLQNSNNAQTPVPFVDDPAPYNGWIWQFYNLANGTESFTGAGFIQGQQTAAVPLSYGYFLSMNGKGGWNALFVNGSITQQAPEQFPAIPGNPNGSNEVTCYTQREYAGIKNLFSSQPALSGTASPWFADGTFLLPNYGICAEIPADYTDSSGHYPNGLGYMESVGFETVAAYETYVLGLLNGLVQ